MNILAKKIRLSGKHYTLVRVPLATIVDMKKAAYMFIACQRQFPASSLVLAAIDAEGNTHYQGAVERSAMLDQAAATTEGWQTYRLNPAPFIGRVA